MGESGESQAPKPVTFEELAAWRAGELSAEEEVRLLTRLSEDPEAREKVAILASVDQMFAQPAHVEIPEDMPADVAARLQMLLAREAVRRAEQEDERPDPPADDE